MGLHMANVPVPDRRLDEGAAGGGRSDGPRKKGEDGQEVVTKLR